jgi:hypothetical protein
MATALRQAIILWVSLLILGGLTFFILQLPATRAWLWRQTGEEAFLSQVKGVTDLAGDLLRARPDLALDAPIDHANVNPFGVNVFLEQEVDPAKRAQAVRMAAEVGFHWLRQEFTWEDIEIHGKGDFEDRRHDPPRSAWDKYDHIVDLAEQHDMELIVRISNPPEWTRRQGGGVDNVDNYAPPDDYQDYADFVAAVVGRYRGRIRYYQLWNEPNIHPEWGSYTISPEDYTRLVKAGAEAARAADPDAVIILGALAATINFQQDDPPPANSLNDFLFLQRMYDAGAGPYFDIVAVQGYGLYSGPTDQRMHPRVINISRHYFIRDIMVKSGDSHKPIWITEMNWNAGPVDVEPRYGRVTLEQQARYLPAAYQRLIKEWPWVGVACAWYLKRADDQWLANRQPEAYFQLLAPDFTPQPVYEAMQAFTKSVADRYD